MSSFALPPTLATIPTEVLETLLPYLCQNDLCQCVLTCREWNRTLIPYLWRTLAVNSRRQFEGLCNDEVQQALKKNGPFVRELQLDHKTLYNLLLPLLETLFFEPGIEEHVAYKISPFTRLHTLELHRIKKYPKNCFDGRIFALVRQNPTIKRFKISMQMDPNTLLELVKQHMPNLEDLDLDITWQGNVKELLETLPGKLRTVRILGVQHSASHQLAKGSKAYYANMAARIVRPHHALETLDISGSLNGQEEDVLVRFLKSCSSKLRAFKGKGFTWCCGNDALTQALLSIGFVFTELYISDIPYYIPDDDLAGIISNRPWVVLELNTRHMRSMAVDALVENCDDLTVLSLVEPSNYHLAKACTLTDTHMRIIVSKAKNLKSLHIQSILMAHTIMSRDVFMSDWATTTLEQISFKIEVPRVNMDEIIDEEDEPFQTSRHIQRQVFRRLGQHKHLKKLNIGGKVTDPSSGLYKIQYNCLELTLEAGLDELRDLKRLEVLNVRNMDHRIGVPELEWMVHNWPRLNLVLGALEGPDLPNDKPVQGLKSDDANIATRKVRSHRALESFVIDGMLFEEEEEEEKDVLFEFLKSCSSELHTLGGLVPTWGIEHVAITEALKSIGFIWKELRREALSPDEPDGRVAYFIANYPLTLIDAHAQNVGPMSVGALLENCDNLTVFSIVGSGTTALTGAHMQTILSRARHSKFCQVHGIVDTHMISARNILMSEWASTTLEHLEFKIEVPRVHDEEIADGEDQAVAILNSRDVQRKLLQRLGQQKQLKTLALGGMVITPITGQPGNQRNCLEFSLEAGLDELEDLKKLELLEIHHMDHPVGLPELEWMAENWPRSVRVRR
ncbi:hypothetical protein EMPS_09164 [Entomortierella parvispora]|uniref:F-box domain-containing protein n=1 Tax=Entomortierella parvispora TaxID=205924 RepID=A0A9P3HHS7_9FUNG|nr:hypothetical protein EMPS_09164 [Entomortierella parvispora]